MKRLKKPVYCIPGNHDDPELLYEHFPNTPINTVTSLKHNNNLLIFVNTQVSSQQYGLIKKNDLTDISRLLDNNRNLNAVIILHHPPVLINSEWMDNIGLKNAVAFMQSVQQYQNLKLILCGHVHQTINTTHQHIQIFATPSTCYQFKPHSKKMQYDNLSPAYRHVKIDDTGTITSQVHRLSPQRMHL